MKKGGRSGCSCWLQSRPEKEQNCTEYTREVCFLFQFYGLVYVWRNGIHTHLIIVVRQAKELFSPSGIRDGVLRIAEDWWCVCR